jgi:hypothetical protein
MYLLVKFSNIEAAKFIIFPAKLHIQVALVPHTSSYNLPVKFSNVVAAKFIISPAKLHIQVAVVPYLTPLATGTVFHLNFQILWQPSSSSLWPSFTSRKP